MLLSIFAVACLSSGASALNVSTSISNYGISHFDDALLKYYTFTNVSKYRPSIFQIAFVQYEERVSNDCSQIWENMFVKCLEKWCIDPRGTLNALRAIVGVYICSLASIFLFLPTVAMLLPFIWLRNLSPDILPAIAFELTMKQLLTIAFVFRHPISAAIVIKGIVCRFFSRSNKSTD